uniref:Uncharacterized protein n=1 Tax=Arundo donax TaxID=35708 RepID=A0A0A9B9I5_ARUDO
MVPMTVCHILLGRPWQFDHSSLHCGQTNQYTIRRKGKDIVLKHMTPQQIMSEQVQKNSDHEKEVVAAIHPCEIVKSSERKVAHVPTNTQVQINEDPRLSDVSRCVVPSAAACVEFLADRADMVSSNTPSLVQHEK